jgi:hypothetical protein
VSQHYFAVLGQGLYATQLLELAVVRYLVACRLYGPPVDSDQLLRDVRTLNQDTLGGLRRRVEQEGGNLEIFDLLSPLVDERNGFIHRLLHAAPGRAFVGITQEQEIEDVVAMTRRFITAARSIGTSADERTDIGRGGPPTGRDAALALAGRAFTAALKRMTSLEWNPPDLMYP